MLLLFLVLNLSSVFEKWHKEGGDLGKMVAEYLKKEPPYGEDYIMAIFAMDILAEVDSASKKDVEKALYQNATGNCKFSRDFSDKLKVFSLKCYLDKHEPVMGDSILRYISGNYSSCMALYFMGRYYASFGNTKRGERYLKKSISNCKGIVPLWARDILYRE